MEPAGHCPTTLLLLDLQEGMVEASRTLPPPVLRRSVATLVAVAVALRFPCYASLIPSPGGGPPPRLIAEIDPGVLARKPEARRGVSAAAPDIGTVGRLLLAGVATEAAVYHTAMRALADGWTVDVVLDACGGLSQRSEDAALRGLERAGVGLTSVVTLATAFVVDLAREDDRAVMAALVGDRVVGPVAD